MGRSINGQHGYSLTGSKMKNSANHKMALQHKTHRDGMNAHIISA
jgi:hypothetical protein